MLMITGLALNDAGAREIKEASFHIIHNRKVVGILETALPALSTTQGEKWAFDCV